MVQFKRHFLLGLLVLGLFTIVIRACDDGDNGGGGAANRTALQGNELNRNSGDRTEASGQDSTNTGRGNGRRGRRRG